MKHSRGNILFLILLAVVLFAALSYAVTQSTRGGGNDASNEKTQAQMSELLNYYAQIDAAVQRLMLTGGLKDYELNFYYMNANKFVFGNFDNSNCTESRCRVFDPAGGGVSGRSLMPFTRAGYTTPERLLYVSVPGVGTSAPDIVLGMHQANTALCLEINKRFGVNGFILNASPAEGSSTIMYQFAPPVGAFPTSTASMTNIPVEAALNGTFCSCNSGTQALCEADVLRPNIYHVILAR